jgi:peptidyl-prolyl cis-trans isomerase SurA
MGRGLPGFAGSGPAREEVRVSIFLKSPFSFKALLAASASAAFAVAAVQAFAQSAPAQPAAKSADVPGKPGEDRKGIPASYSGPVSAVAAIVDDKVITTYDVQQRMRLMIMGARGQINAQMLPQIQRQALRDLIEEQLKLKEAEKFEVKVEDKEIQGELRQMAAQSGISVDQLEQALGAEGIKIETLRSQISAGIVWPQIVQGRYGKRVRISDDEIDRTLERLRADATQEQFLVAEICLPVPSPDQAQTYYQGGLQLLEQMRRGVPFSVVAQQFSACTTAAAGGDLGWVRPGELPPELDEAIRNLAPGSVTNPIASDNAFMILAVRDRRAAVKQGEKTWTLAYAGAPVSVGRAAARTALEKLPASEACAGGRTLRQDLGPDVGVAMIENVKLSDLDERMRPAVEGLERNELSEIIEADDALHVFYACEVDEGLGIPSRKSIEDKLYGRQLERIAQQYLRDIERKSTVDVRLKTPTGREGATSPAGQGR